ncbi:MAG: hypothetical protein CO017_03150, partial [Zetaproteobacteria bacterium CG_4_8_14_3_um_filter_59_5]
MMMKTVLIRLLGPAALVLLLVPPVCAADGLGSSDPNSLFSVDRDSAINGRIKAVNHAEIASVMDA